MLGHALPLSKSLLSQPQYRELSTTQDRSFVDGAGLNVPNCPMEILFKCVG